MNAGLQRLIPPFKSRKPINRKKKGFYLPAIGSPRFLALLEIFATFLYSDGTSILRTERERGGRWVGEGRGCKYRELEYRNIGAYKKT